MTDLYLTATTITTKTDLESSNNSEPCNIIGSVLMFVAYAVCFLMLPLIPTALLCFTTIIMGVLMFIAYAVCFLILIQQLLRIDVIILCVYLLVAYGCMVGMYFINYN